MKKHIVAHFAFWITLICLDVSSYIPAWRSSFGVSAIVNYSWLLLIFYTAYLTGLSFFKREYEFKQLTRYLQFWIILFLPIFYIFGTMVTDKYVIGYFGALSIWTYAVSRFIMIYPFIGSAIFLAGFLTKAIQFANSFKEIIVLRMEKTKLIEEINLLKFEKIAVREEVDEIRREYRRKMNYYEKEIERLKNGDIGTNE